MEINSFDTCFLPEHLIGDSTTKSFVQKLLPKESNKKALVGYDYINHLKILGFDKSQLQTLRIENHADHENTVLLLDWQRNLFYYIRILPIENFKCYQVVKELSKCNDFLKSFVLLHETKERSDNLAVCAMLALPNISSTEIQTEQWDISSHLKSFIILKEDADSGDKLKTKLNKMYDAVNKGRKDRGVALKIEASISSQLSQILSERMATMALVDVALPRLTKNIYKQVNSLLLNKEQYEVIHHPDNHIIITGGYGCGKSLILLEIAKNLFLKQENIAIFYICSDSYSLLPARINEFFRDLVNKYPERSHIKLHAVGINQTDKKLGEDKRHLPSVMEYYTKQTTELQNTCLLYTSPSPRDS